MSKLFNTLEKIKKNEEDALSPVVHDKAGKNPQQPRKLLWLVISLTVVIGLLFASRSFSPNNFSQLINRFYGVEKFSETDKPQQGVLEGALTEAGGTTDSVADFEQDTSAGSTLAQMIILNNTGTRHVQQGRYWQGIYCFDQARKMQPERIEPLINLAVALSELQLFAPAHRFFKKAMKIDANHPLLKENIALIAHPPIGQE